MSEWLQRLFSPPATAGVDRLTELEEFCGPDAATLERLTQVFEDAANILAPFPDESVDQAFWDLIAALSAITDESIDLAVRHRLIQSFETLFREVFAVRCQPVLGHLSEAGSPLNSSCYMWWDFDCWRFADPLLRKPLDSAFLASMRSILAINHIACQESALHGLGHWHQEHSAQVEYIIDEFLERQDHLPDPLRKYAYSARKGSVL